jgi:hypothetical protein
VIRATFLRVKGSAAGMGPDRRNIWVLLGCQSASRLPTVEETIVECPDAEDSINREKIRNAELGAALSIM